MTRHAEGTMESAVDGIIVALVTPLSAAERTRLRAVLEGVEVL